MYLSPRDAYSLFRRPTQRQVSLTTTPAEIVSENPDRVVLIFSHEQSVSPILGVAADLSATNGMFLQGNNNPLVVTQQQHGPLAQCAWYGMTGIGTISVTVFEVILDRFPSDINERGP